METKTAIAAAKGTLPASIRRVVQLGARTVDADRVILYGSHARGDAREDSDYDLAFVFPADRHNEWARFVVDLDDAAVTLLPVDLLDWNEASEPLRERIQREGIVLYERRVGGWELLTSHLYQEAIAVEIAQRVVEEYLVMLGAAYQACSWSP